MSSYRDRKRKPIAEINVVPYIDVMLVLLIIFMVTAPLLTEGVKLELPQTEANPIEFNPESPEPVIVSVDEQGLMYVDADVKEPEDLLRYAKAVKLAKPTTDFLVRGARQADYQYIIKAIVILKAAGVDSVNLVTEPVSAK